MITIYSTATCARCKLLMVALMEAGITYEEKSLDAAAIAACLCDTERYVMEAPLVYKDDRWQFANDLFDAAGLKSNWMEILMR